MIDKNSHIPIYIQIEHILLDKIEKGELVPGDSIPSETTLADLYQISRMTARKAVDYLVRQGVVERCRGRGTFVSQPNIELKMALPLDSHLTSSEVAISLNSPIENRLLHLDKVKAPKIVSDELGISEISDVWFMKRLRLINDIPFVFESSYMLAEPMFGDLTKDILNSSKYSYIIDKGYKIEGSKKQLRGELPPEEVRKFLGLKREEPVLFAHSVAMLDSGIKFEVSDVYYNQKYYTFTVNSSRDS